MRVKSHHGVEMQFAGAEVLQDAGELLTRAGGPHSQECGGLGISEYLHAVVEEARKARADDDISSFDFRQMLHDLCDGFALL